MKIKYSKKFKKSFKNIISQYPSLEEKIWIVIIDFDEKLYDSMYFRKNFSYLNRKITELEFWWDWRILLELIIIDNEIRLLNIWSHSSLELSSKKKLKI